MTTKTRTPRRGRTMLGGVEPFALLPDKDGLAPVAEVGEEFGRAQDAHAAAGTEAMRARKHAEGSPREDERLPAAGVEAGKAIPEPIAPAARAALLQAERQVGATERVATDRQNAYLAAVIDHHGELVAAFGE